MERLAFQKRRVLLLQLWLKNLILKKQLKEIFSFTEEGISNNGEVIGSFKQYKYVPHVYEKMKRKGIKLESIFGE